MAVRQRQLRLRGRAGVTSLELALVMVPFMYMLMAVTDLARYFFTIQAMTTLMNDSIRYDWITGMARDDAAHVTTGGGPLGSSCVTFSQAQATSGVAVSPLLWDDSASKIGFDFNPVTLLSTDPNGGGVSQAQIYMQYPFSAITPGLQVLNGTLTMQSGLSY